MRLTKWQILVTSIFSLAYVTSLVLGMGQEHSLIIALVVPAIFVLVTIKSGQATKAITSWESSALIALYFSSLFIFGVSCLLFLSILRPGVLPSLYLALVDILLFAFTVFFVRIVARKFQLAPLSALWRFLINGMIFCLVWSLGSLFAR